MRFCSLVALLAFAGVAAGGENWLARASEAVRTTDYYGTLVYLRNGKLDTLRVVHRYRDGDERARLVSLSGAPREIIRANGVVTCVLPAQRLVLVARHPMPEMFSRVGRLFSEGVGKNYQVRELGLRRLAGRMCRAVAIEAKDPYRYGYHLLIDVKTNLPLKFDLVHGGEVLEQLMFTDISFPEQIPDSALAATFDVQGYRELRRSAIKVNSTPPPATSWYAAKLPPGFHLAAGDMLSVGPGRVALQLLYTDDMATVSAFVAARQDPGFTGATTMGAVNAYGRIVGGYQITVVGEVPQTTVRLIAENMRHGPTVADTQN